ncbi:hypothetical protein [Paenibacillus sp. FSL K6-1558]|uniref:hypothetical protein n=1 Tax=Paenibacillus sp. FSL K6-1558 TaxID=2921473 RepID=UPI0030FA9E0A
MARARRANVTYTGDMDLSVMVNRVRPLIDKEVVIGVEGNAELAMIAAVHEFGSAKMNIPARSFIGSGKKKAQAAISKLVRAGVNEIALGNKSVESLLQEIGQVGQQRVVKNFDRIKQPGLSVIYARVKKGNRLLQSDMDLRESIVFRVRNKGG